MKYGKLLVGYSFLILGVICAGISVYLLFDQRLELVLITESSIKTEVILLLICSLLLAYSGIKTIQKENKRHKFKQSDLLDD